MKPIVLLTGGTGLIGKKITKKLTSAGFHLNILSRSPRENEPNVSYYKWDLTKAYINEEAFNGVEYVIHLAGAPIAKRWTKEYKKVIIKSRVESANLLYETIKKLELTLKSYIGASASGFYKTNTGIVFEETGKSGTDFLSKVCKEWEASSFQFNDVAERVVIHRIGFVLAKKDGALGKMIPPIEYGLAPYFGDGQQFYPWVHVDDVASQFVFAITHRLNGIFNANTGNITNRELNKAIANALHKKAISLPVPKFALQIVLGDMSSILVDSIKMSSSKIRHAGFTPNYTLLSEALSQLL